MLRPRSHPPDFCPVYRPRTPIPPSAAARLTHLLLLLSNPVHQDGESVPAHLAALVVEVERLVAHAGRAQLPHQLGERVAQPLLPALLVNLRQQQRRMPVSVTSDWCTRNTEI